MIVPYDQLQTETLQALIEEFVSRQGGVHGHEDVSLVQQVESVKRQLKAGKVVIVFDREDETCSIMPADAVRL